MKWKHIQPLLPSSLPWDWNPEYAPAPGFNIEDVLLVLKVYACDWYRQ
jgi:hypothetical protein